MEVLSYLGGGWLHSGLKASLTTMKVMDSHLLLVSDFFPLTASPSIPGKAESLDYRDYH